MPLIIFVIILTLVRSLARSSKITSYSKRPLRIVIMQASKRHLCSNKSVQALNSKGKDIEEACSILRNQTFIE